jgi:hypothetical protein
MAVHREFTYVVASKFAFRVNQRVRVDSALPPCHKVPMKHSSHEAPTASWIFGRDADGEQRYVIHTEAPAFIAKLADNDEEGVLSGLSYALSDGRSLYDFIWFDEVPAENELRTLLAEAERAVESQESDEEQERSR